MYKVKKELCYYVQTVTNEEKSEMDDLMDVSLVGENQNGFKQRLKELQFDWKIDGLRTQGSFYYLAFQDGVPAQDLFVQFIYAQIIPFCLERGYIKDSFKKIGAGDHQEALKVADEARNTFINAKKKNSKTGEPGEVILFSLLEYAVGAPRVLSKMWLKTNRNIEAFGSDGIHMKYDANDGYLYIYWGEAKLYQSITKAINRIVLSIKAYLTKDSAGKSGRDYDISLIERHSDLYNEDASKALIEYLNPYHDSHEKLKEIYACVGVWDCAIYEEIKGKNPDEIERIFIEKYKEQITKACQSFHAKILKHELQHLRFHFFLVPIKSAKDFRKLFCQKVGIEYEELVEDQLDGDDE